jgi:hypothetical protein
MRDFDLKLSPETSATTSYSVPWDSNLRHNNHQIATLRLWPVPHTVNTVKNKIGWFRSGTPTDNSIQLLVHVFDFIFSVFKISDFIIQILIDWLIVYGFTSRSRMFHLYGNATSSGEGLQNLGLCSALRVFEQGGIFIVPHLLWHGTSVSPVLSKGTPHSVASYDTRGDVENLF